MAVADIPVELIVNERSSYEQYLWKLPGVELYRWDSNVQYMYLIRASPVDGQGLPPLPPVPPLPAPFTAAQVKYLSQTYAKSVNGVPVDADGNVVLEIIDAAARATANAAAPMSRLVATGTGLIGGRDLNADMTIALSGSSVASLAKADSASQPGHKHVAADLTDASVVGKQVLTAVDQATARNALAVPDWGNQIAAGTGLTGGGNLTVSRTIALSAASIASLAKADAAIPRGTASIVYADVDPSIAAAINNGAAAYGALSSKADLVGGFIPTNQIPAIALGTSVQVASRTAMLALTTSQVQPGDLAIDTSAQGPSSTRGTYQLVGTDPSVIGNWNLLNANSDAVQSVNGQAGTVVLGKADVGLGNVDNTSDVNKPVSTAQATAIGAKVDKTTTLTAGTGLTGGGDLSTGRSFGLTTAAQASLALANTASQPGHTHTASQISDASTVGRNVLTAADAATARNALAAAAWGISINPGTGLQGGGDLTANRTLSLSTAAQTSLGKADTAVQPARAVGTGTGLTGGGDLSADRTIALTAAAQASLAKADAAVASDGNILRVAKITQAAYTALATKDASTLYCIVG